MSKQAAQPEFKGSTGRLLARSRSSAAVEADSIKITGVVEDIPRFGGGTEEEALRNDMEGILPYNKKKSNTRHDIWKFWGGGFSRENICC